MEVRLLESVLSLPFLAGAVVGGLLVYLVFLVVRREKVALKALTYSVASKLLVAAEAVPDLVITFRGEPIRSMYAHEIILRNVGTVALTNVAVRLTSSGGRMRRPKIRGPLGASIQHEPLVDGEGFILKCDLLNRGESVVVDAQTIDPDDGSVTIVARDADLMVKSVPIDAWRDAGQALDASKLLDLAAILNPGLTVPVQVVKKLFIS